MEINAPHSQQCLPRGNFNLVAHEEDAYAFKISISTGEIKFDQIFEWLKINTEAL